MGWIGWGGVTGDADRVCGLIGAKTKCTGRRVGRWVGGWYHHITSCSVMFCSVPPPSVAGAGVPRKRLRCLPWPPPGSSHTRTLSGEGEGGGEGGGEGEGEGGG